MPNAYYTLAHRVFTTEFESNTGVTTLSQISGWFSANIGGLNAQLHTNFTGEASDMDESAGNIFSLMYLQKYYEKAASNALRGIIQSNGVLSIGDGDNKISFTNKNEVAKVFRGMANDIANEIKDLANKYNLYYASPRQVVGYDSPQYCENASI